jgi:hypothetical protein
VLSVTSLVIEHNSSVGAIEQHWRLTVTSFVLSALAVFVSLVRLVLPRSAGLSLLPSPLLSTPVYRASLALLLTATLLEIGVFLMLGSIPRCAPLVHPITGKEIVTQPSCSPISYMLFVWITPVLKLAYHADIIGEDMLPSLPAADRARNGWDRIRASEHLMNEAPKGWNALLWRIVVVNKRLFIWRASRSL